MFKKLELAVTKQKENTHPTLLEFPTAGCQFYSLHASVLEQLQTCS
jgi:hypothetical protein